MKRFHFLCIAVLFAAVLPGVAFAQAAAPQSRSEGFSVLQLILLGLVVYWIVRMIRRGSGMRGPGMRGPGMRGPSQRNDMPGSPQAKPDRYTQAQAMWEALGGEPAARDAQHGTIDVLPELPEGFDVAEFVQGAEAAFVRILEAEEGDEVLTHIAEPQALMDLKAALGGQRQSVKRVSARLMGVETLDGRVTATVWYDAVLRGGGFGRFQQTWEFVRDAADADSSWKFSAVGTATA